MEPEVENMLKLFVEAVRQSNQAAVGAIETNRQHSLGIQAGYFEWDLETDRVLYSREAYDILGLDYRKPFHRLSWRHLVVPEDVPKVMHDLAEAIARGRLLVTAARLKDAPNPWVICLAQPVIDSNGVVTRLCGKLCLADLEILRCLAPEEQPGNRFRARASEITFPVILTDVGGRTLWVNRAFTTLCGYELAEMEGRKPGDVLQRQRTNRQTVQKMAAAIELGEEFHGTVVNFTKLGRRYKAELHFAPVHGLHGSLWGFVAVLAELRPGNPESQEAGALVPLLHELKGILEPQRNFSEPSSMPMSKARHVSASTKR